MVLKITLAAELVGGLVDLVSGGAFIGHVLRARRGNSQSAGSKSCESDGAEKSGVQPALFLRRCDASEAIEAALQRPK
jgi:hypothetical protein